MLVVAMLAAIVVRQRTVLVAQIDDQLDVVTTAASRARFTSAADATATVRPDGGPPTGELYLAVLDNGTLTTVASPASDPGLVPDLDRLDPPLDRLGPVPGDTIGPLTVALTDGAGRARIVVARVDDSHSVVVAHSMARIDEAERQLLVAAIVAVLAVVVTMGLVLWWVDRLGLRPISRLTAAAEDVAAGRSDRRVEHPPPTTETGRLGAAFNTMLDARQTAEDRQRRFVADASHELRTPLTTLRGYTALHASGGLSSPEAVDDAMGRIGTEAERMAALVEDLLTLASLDDDRPLDVATVDLSQLLVDIGSDARAVQPDRPVDTSGVESALSVRADQHLLTQAITAVTTNVLRHTPPTAGLTIAASRAPGGERVIVDIADRGPGIDPDQLPHLFDRFYRADSGRAAPSGGRGLGLSIARTVVEAHGGTIAARSTPGRGTTVTIELPTRSSGNL